MNDSHLVASAKTERNTIGTDFAQSTTIKICVGIHSGDIILFDS